MRKFSISVQIVPVIAAMLTVGSLSGQTANSTTVADMTLSGSQISDPPPPTDDPGTLMIRPLGLAGARNPDPVGVNRGNGSGGGIPPIEKPGFYPADLSNPDNNPAIVTTLHHPIYVDRPSTHWGDPAKFIKDLGKSEFMEVVDQYVGASGSNRYKLGQGFKTASYLGTSTYISINSIANLVSAAAIFGGKNFDHVYHVFLPKGVDTCFDAAKTVCYSPDIPKTFFFCAYHASITYKDGSSLLFSVEPYQDVLGCSVPPTGSANSQLIDSTDSVLSHEIFETITDPLGTSWWVQALTFANGEEIGDLCTRAQQGSDSNYYWDYGKVKLNGNWYTVQPEYSNAFHGCVYSDLDKP